MDCFLSLLLVWPLLLAANVVCAHATAINSATNFISAMDVSAEKLWSSRSQQQQQEERGIRRGTWNDLKRLEFIN